MVMDCNDFDGQLFEIFCKNVDLIWEMLVQVDSCEELCCLLDSCFFGGVIFIIIQKFGFEVGEKVFLVLIKCENVVVICDEVYCSQYGFIVYIEEKDGFFKYGYVKYMCDVLLVVMFVVFMGILVSSID